MEWRIYLVFILNSMLQIRGSQSVVCELHSGGIKKIIQICKSYKNSMILVEYIKYYRKFFLFFTEAVFRIVVLCSILAV
jgi:hypothetical protein